jgi:hypothetical protein
MRDSSPLQVVDGLDVNEVKDGLIVYDPARDRVHYLNATAAIVFVLCDGTLDEPGIAGELAEAYGLDRPVADEVRECLEGLRTEGLLR